MLTEKQAIAYLTKNGAHLRVPCSRYGYDSESCAQVAYAAAVIYMNESGAEALTTKALDYVMGLVVNDHDDPEYLIRNYGAQYGFSADDLLD